MKYIMSPHECPIPANNEGITECGSDLQQKSNLPKRAYEYRKTSVHEGNLATKLTIYVEVWFRAGELKWIKGRKQRQKYAGHIMCMKTDVDTIEKLLTVTDHMFKQICDKYKVSL